MDDKNIQQRRFQPKMILAGILSIIFAISLVVILHPGLRESVRSQWNRQYRTVLSTVTGDLMHDGTSIKVVKLKTNEGLFLEIYGFGQGHVRPLIDRIRLPDRRDGFIHLHGQATNLAVNDIDGDMKFEILAPTFDEDLVAHLNIYHYNPDSGHFEVFRP